QQDLVIAQSQLRDYQERLGKPFPHDAYLSALTTLRDHLRVALSNRTQDTTDAGQVTLIDLAQQIHQLKASNTIDNSMERSSKCRASIEESVTARIRRRAESPSTETGSE